MPTPHCVPERNRLVEEVIHDYARTGNGTGLSRPDPRVVAALLAVDRARFVPEDLVPQAWRNQPLPIGHDQTISQPFIVALMTDLLDLAPTDRVLEIGTGCGYQAAVLAQIVQSVFSVEIVAELAATAARRLEQLGYGNIKVRHGNGRLGWPEFAPFDAIVVTAGGSRTPPALLDQLAPMGRLVMPLEQDNSEVLTLIRKTASGMITRKPLLDVRFVPLTGAEDAEEDGAGKYPIR